MSTEGNRGLRLSLGRKPLNGHRGEPPRPQNKKPNLVSREEATRVCDALVRPKLREYSPGEDEAAPLGTAPEARFMGITRKRRGQ